ncbi:MAG: beta-galactosidase [Planctomycetes bacterium]|nr:beta-galactosidase [Planctomycetota bacterium]
MGLSRGAAQVASQPAGPESIPLAGSWGFALDPDGVGVDQQWFANDLADTVELPGTTDENHRGIQQDERRTDRLSRPWYWKGPAWYQRRVTIPAGWRDRRITLFLERSKHTRVWVDREFCGWDDTLSAPQVFDVTPAMTPGEHTITLLVDNARLPPVGPAHAVDERTQTNWNGVIGRLELRATAPVWLADVQVYPDVETRTARVRVVVGNVTGRVVSGRVTVRCESHDVPVPVSFAPADFAVHAPGRETVVELTYAPGTDVPLWDEFRPAMLRLQLDLETQLAETVMLDRRIVDVGMRSFVRSGRHLLVNGRRVFLRGKNDCCFFPLTGYPPMEVGGWRRVLSIAKDWGINHYRFHSWCPPEAAFQAADELGVYFQVELPNKRSGFRAPEDPEAALRNIDRLDVATTSTEWTLYEYARREAELIFAAFGNHPSFMTFTLGNELGRDPAMFELVARFKELDPRRLYAQGTNNVHWNPQLAGGDEFWVTAKTTKSLAVRGSFSTLDFPTPHIETRPPSTLVDYSESIRDVPVPVIGHETGQFQVYPDYRDIPEFTGVLRARSYEIFRDRLDAAGMLDQARDFVRASGALSARLYREDIEAALRTPELAGFQLLDLQDFPGQGTALVGMLNVFMESKGIIDPAEWRQSCCETVPLLRMAKYVWTVGETFAARVEVAHYGPADLPQAHLVGTVADGEGRVVFAAHLPVRDLETGGLRDVGALTFAVGSVSVGAPEQLWITLVIEGTDYRNRYPIWIYPSEVDTSVPDGVLLTDDYAAEETRHHLAAGGRVLLLPRLDRLPLSVAGAFQCEFWSPMFAAAARRRGLEPPPGTLGILCDPSSPALAAFPTAFHSDWQWWHLVKHARPLVLDATPPDYRPIVQVIDNFDRNHKLGLIAETRVGTGALLVCAIDLLGQQEQPAARQLLHSLLRYVGSERFAPRAELDASVLQRLFPAGE